MSAPERPEDWFHQRATHYVVAQVLFHLNRVGVFRLLDDGAPRTVEAIAAALGLDAHHLRCCLEYAHGVDRVLELDPEGRYGFSDFGRRVLQRYGREDPDGRTFNLFDVRVGSYGPVWASLDRLMTGEARYGRELRRAGREAAAAVYKISPLLLPGLSQAIRDLGLRTLLEVGVTTGLLARALEEHPGLHAVGLDRDHAALDAADARATELGAAGIRWLQGDFFDPSSWAAAVADTPAPGAIASVHFHELLARGPDALQAALRALGERLPDWYVIAMEQERLTESQRDEVPPTLWSYSCSNVFIHHLIGNGRILRRDEWVQLFAEAGCVTERVQPLGYLGYHVYVFRLPGPG